MPLRCDLTPDVTRQPRGMVRVSRHAADSLAQVGALLCAALACKPISRISSFLHLWRSVYGVIPEPLLVNVYLLASLELLVSILGVRIKVGYFVPHA